MILIELSEWEVEKLMECRKNAFFIGSSLQTMMRQAIIDLHNKNVVRKNVE